MKEPTEKHFTWEDAVFVVILFASLFGSAWVHKYVTDAIHTHQQKYEWHRR